MVSTLHSMARIGGVSRMGKASNVLPLPLSVAAGNVLVTAGDFAEALSCSRPSLSMTEMNRRVCATQIRTPENLAG